MGQAAILRHGAARRGTAVGSGSRSTPDLRFGQAHFGEVAGTQGGVDIAEEFVELGRLDRGASKHRMRLSAMMDLVLEQVAEQARARFALRVAWPQDGEGAIQRVVAEVWAVIDQPSIR